MTEAFTIVPIVEGQGEMAAVPILLRNIASALAPERFVDIARPIRRPRSSLLKQGELERYVELAIRTHRGHGGVLVLIDADDDCAATLGPELQRRASAARPASPVGVVLAVKEYECWFIAAAASLAGHRGLPVDLEPPEDAEAIRDAKGWLKSRRTDGLSYGPTIDQPALTAIFDMAVARANAPSFDKLWREVERLLS